MENHTSDLQGISGSRSETHWSTDQTNSHLSVMDVLYSVWEKIPTIKL